MMALSILAIAIFVPVLLIVLFLLIQVITGVIVYKKYNLPLSGTRKPVTVLIPAHNESLVIEQTLKSLINQLNEDDRVVLVADNCTDNTVEIANMFKIKVLIRTDLERRGKGYALDFGVRHIEESPSDIVIILDADCLLEENAIDQLAIAANKYKKPIQSLYLMKSPHNKSNGQKISQFAFFIKNHIRPLGLKCLGLPCQLMGSGMSFPWELLKNAELANGDLVEDMKLGVDCMLNGTPSVFIPSAKVISYFPNEDSAKSTQSTRWEHGHLNTIKSYVPDLLKTSLKRKKIKFGLFALDLSIPPLSLMVILLCIFTLLQIFISIFSKQYLLVEYSIYLLISFIVSILVAWFAYGRNIISVKELICIPFYILKKITIYLNYITNKQVSWVRTQRDKTDK